ATRQETPEDIRYGIPKVKEILKAFNIPVLELDGYEADDIIGTLAQQAAEKGFEVYMMTPDKDFGQLVTDKIKLYKPAYMGNAVDVMGPKEVCARWDIEDVSQVIEMLGLQGDASDNIPGIPGFGPKTAATLLKKYKTIEGIIEHVSELKGKQKELVEQYGEQALLSKKLATIITDVPIEFDEQALEYKGPDEAALKPIFQELEFKTIMNRVFGEAAVAAPAVPKVSQLSMFGNTATEEVADENTITASEGSRSFSKENVTYQSVTAKEQSDFIRDLKNSAAFAWTIQTSTDKTVTGMSFSIKPGEAFFVSIESEKQLQEFTDVFADPSKLKIGHNIKPALL